MRGLPIGWEGARLGDICLGVSQHNPRESAQAEFNYIDIEARYQLGKFTLSASYDRNVLNTGTGPTFGGSTFNRFRLRLMRSFTIF